LTRKKEIMPTERFKYYVKKIQQEIDQYDTLTFSGFGEPLLDRDFIKKAEIVKNEGFDVLLLTNGSLLSVDLFRQINNFGLESVRISFYGMKVDSYKRVHNINGNILFDKVKNTLTEICMMNRRTKIIFTYNVVSGENDEDIQEWINYWEPLADLLEIWKPHNWVDGRNYRAIKREKLKTCGRPFNGPLQVQVDGTVNMCCFDYNGKLLLGDLNSQSLYEIFNSEEYKKIKECHLSGKFEGSGLICEMCDQRNADKSDIMIYNSKFDINERVNMVSTIYKKLI
jgi:MoaA/NifB/PqqE/SkfB family radical SAM enzyme